MDIDEKIKKLPKWVQGHIENIELQKSLLQEKVNILKDDISQIVKPEECASILWTSNLIEYQGIPKTSRVIFKPNSQRSIRSEIQISIVHTDHGPNYLQIYAGNTLKIIPQAMNSIRLINERLI